MGVLYLMDRGYSSKYTELRHRELTTSQTHYGSYTLHDGPREHIHMNVSNRVSKVYQNEPRQHSRGGYVHSHDDSQGHINANTLSNANDINQNDQQTRSHGSFVHTHLGQNGHAHSNHPASNINLDRSIVLKGRPQQWNSQNLLNQNINLPRDETFRNLLRTRGLSSSRSVRRNYQPNYQLAGGVSCQRQCMNGVASRTCYCARYMCYYQGCSSSCNLIRQGTNIRADCQQWRSRTTPTSNNLNIPRCQQPIDPGTCNSRLYTRYGFDSQSQTCIRFIYSGCGGNENRFTSRNSCQTSCAL